MKSLVLASLLLISSNTFAGEIFAELGVGNNTNLTGSSVPWDDGGGTGCMLKVYYQTGGWIMGWTHLSQCDVGPPFNFKDESSVDHIGIAYRWSLWKSKK